MASFKVLDVWRPIPQELAYYKVLVGTDTIKYFVVDKPKPGRFRYNKTEHLAFDTIPEGNWTIAHLAHDDTDNLVIVSVETKHLPDITDSWHPVKIDLQSLGEEVMDPPWNDFIHVMGHLPIATFNGPPNIGAPRVFAMWEPWYHHPVSFLKYDCHYRALVQGQDISPRFLGHLTENNTRIIGYILESIDARAATINDLTACQAVLKKLHDLGIAHGRVKRDNFMVLDNGEALLAEFCKSYHTDDPAIFANEIAEVERVLSQPLVVDSFVTINEEMNKQLSEVRERDGGIHPVVLWEAGNEGRITITPKDHKMLLQTLWFEGRQLWSDQHMEHALRCREANSGRWFPITPFIPDNPLPNVSGPA